MKTIGIIGAMDEEIEQIKQKMDIATTKHTVGTDFHIGKMSGKNIVLVRCGIGKVNAAVCTQAMIDLFAADYCVNTGVAGGLNPSLRIGDVVISKDAVQHDLDCTAFGHPIGLVPRLGLRFFDADESLAAMALEAGRAVLPDEVTILPGRIASGDQFISDGAVKTAILRNTSGDCVEMEGASIAQTCWLNKVPFVIIRAISDQADGTADQNFQDFVHLAAARSAALVEAMVLKL